MNFRLNKKFRHVFIAESRAWWKSAQPSYDRSRDLVLTYDFGLKHEIETAGGTALYVDHLVDQATMQKNNFLVYDFFREWHKDSKGEDIFTYQGVPFGFSFRLDIWNDLVFYARTRLCVEQLLKYKFEKLYVGTDLKIIEMILEQEGQKYFPLDKNPETDTAAYYFPIHQWMDERVRSRKWKHRLRDILTPMISSFFLFMDLRLFKKRTSLFLQLYYPTQRILENLKTDSALRIILSFFTHPFSLKKFIAERPIPVWGIKEIHLQAAALLLADFEKRKNAKLILTNKIDVTNAVYQTIEKRIADRLPVYISQLHWIIRFMDRVRLELLILIGNIGPVATLVDCVAKKRSIPSYLIINGLLAKEFLDEATHATYINSYSESIKKHYYRGIKNVFTLGDPRMDAYVSEIKPRTVDRKKPVITIGASGHNNTDLNSYLAVEFDFMFDVLSALNNMRKKGSEFRIIIKVRSNGYKNQYESFVKEYFPGLVDEIHATVSIRSILERTDFYISIYSQTLFEASVLGIPVVYYKKDNEIIDPPFDGKSELVTVGSIKELQVAVQDFQKGKKRFDFFLKKSVMEKYIGALDGKNMERNLDFIYKCLEKKTGLSLQ